jgi:L-ascorbate metabolism protein UlaG (beta-lactamase superfamily)
MEIQWYGHASFLLTTEKGIKIIMDPYEPGSFGGGIMYGPITDKADICLVSHDHADHNYVKGLAGSPQVIKTPGRHEVKGVVIEGIPSFHDASRGSERGNNIIFIIAADGIRLCHLGDLGHLLSDKEVKAIGQVDCLLIPVGGFYTIGPDEATAVADQLLPKLIIPMHWKTEKCGFPIEPVAPFLQGKKQVRKMKGSSFSFTKKELAAGMGIVVLQPAL